MDPTANLTEVLEIAEEILTVDEQEWKEDPATVALVADNGVRLAELVRVLDDWIQRGGFLPQQWKKKR